MKRMVSVNADEGEGDGDGGGGDLIASSGRRLACDKSKKLVWSAQAPIC